MSPCGASVVGYETQLLADQTYEDHRRGSGGGNDNGGQQRPPPSSPSARPEPAGPARPCGGSGVVCDGPADVSDLCRHFLAAYNIRPDFFCKFQRRTAVSATGRRCRFSGTMIIKRHFWSVTCMGPNTYIHTRRRSSVRDAPDRSSISDSRPDLSANRCARPFDARNRFCIYYILGRTLWNAFLRRTKLPWQWGTAPPRLVVKRHLFSLSRSSSNWRNLIISRARFVRNLDKTAVKFQIWKTTSLSDFPVQYHFRKDFVLCLQVIMVWIQNHGD